MSNFRFCIIISIAILSGSVWAHAAKGDEICWTEGPSQFADGVQYCVSSVLPSQGKSDYGPKNLVGYYGSVGAWCEGVDGPGIGEAITIRIDRGPAFRQLAIRNGYNKSRASFTNNGRVKKIKVTSDTGIDTTVTLEDRMGEQTIQLAKVGQHQWIKLEILDVYPGKKFADTCIDDIGPDFVYEEELLQQKQSSSGACLSSGAPVSGRLEIYEEIHPAGYPMRSFHLIPSEQVCIVAGDEQVSEVRRLQLAPVSDQQTQELRGAIGRTLTVKGSFYEPHTAWHTGDVLLSDLEIVAREEAPESPSKLKTTRAQDAFGALEQNTDRAGMDIRSFDLPTATPELCQTACFQNPRCKAFTYVKPGVQSPTARCWLKHGVPRASENTCCISGVKTESTAAEAAEPETSVTPETPPPAASNIAAPPKPAEQVSQSDQETSPQSQSEDKSQLDAIYWDTVKNSNDADLYENYLDRFPDGAFVTEAKDRLRKLNSGVVSDKTEASDLAQNMTPGSAQTEMDEADAELDFWNRVKRSVDPEVVSGYLRRYPDGTFSKLARARIAQLDLDDSAESVTDAPFSTSENVVFESSNLTRGACKILCEDVPFCKDIIAMPEQQGACRLRLDVTHPAFQQLAASCPDTSTLKEEFVEASPNLQTGATGQWRIICGP